MLAILLYMLLFPQVMVDKSKLYRPSSICVKSFKKIGIDYFQFIKASEDVIFVDARRSKVPTKYAGIIPYSNRTELVFTYLSNSTPHACLVAAIDRKVVYVVDKACLTPKNMLHEYLHIYLNLDDRYLPKIDCF